MRTRHIAMSLAIAALGAMALAAPAAAGVTTTRFVDDDGTAGASGCAGGQSVPTSIQAAVDLSAPGDTIKVCPGTYPETVDVDVEGLTIRGVSRWSAKINPTGSAIGAVIRVNADDVRIQWLKVVGRTTGACAFLPAGILVNGVERAAIISNNVLASPKGDARFGACGIQTGIHVATGGTALIRYNIVRDWRLQGIWLQSNDNGSAIKDNSVRFWHPQPVCAAATACTSGVSPAIGGSPIGIHVHNSTAVVSDNVISSGEGSTTSYLVDRGIRVNASTGVKVRGNTITDTGSYGIEINGVSGSRFVDNRLSMGTNGIIMYGGSAGNTLHRNSVQSFAQQGIWLLAGSTPNTLTDNTATGNGVDCKDDAGGNTWTGNTGSTSVPAGLCTI